MSMIEKIYPKGNEIEYRLLTMADCTSYMDTILSWMQNLIKEEIEFCEKVGLEFPNKPEEGNNPLIVRMMNKSAYGAFKGDELLGIAQYIKPEKMMCNVYVRPDSRGQGIGRVLSKLIIDNFNVEQIHVVYCNEPAVKLYQSLGYKLPPVVTMFKK